MTQYRLKHDLPNAKAGDMFEDWLNSTLDPDDPYLKLQRVIKAREASIYSQFVDDVRSLLKSLVLNRNRR